MRCPTCDVRLVQSKQLDGTVLMCPRCGCGWVSAELMRRLSDPPARRYGHCEREPPSPQSACAGSRDDQFNWF